MRKIFALLIIQLVSYSAWSQTMNIHYKSGQKVQYNMENIEYVEFTEEKQSETQVSSGEAIDLGLSVKWSSCNLGATSPEQYGGLYAWGETSTKNKYNRENYLYYDSTTESYMDIGEDISGSEYDAAHVNLGGSWRMPTYNEMKELRDRCTWEWVNVNGVNGWIVKGTNGNSIFFPTGEKNIHLWSSTIFNSNMGAKTGTAFALQFSNSHNPIGYADSGFGREQGNYIRPVMPK